MRDPAGRTTGDNKIAERIARGNDGWYMGLTALQLRAWLIDHKIPVARGAKLKDMQEFMQDNNL